MHGGLHAIGSTAAAGTCCRHMAASMLQLHERDLRHGTAGVHDDACCESMLRASANVRCMLHARPGQCSPLFPLLGRTAAVGHRRPSCVSTKPQSLQPALPLSFVVTARFVVDAAAVNVPPLWPADDARSTLGSSRRVMLLVLSLAIHR